MSWWCGSGEIGLLNMGEAPIAVVHAHEVYSYDDNRCEFIIFHSYSRVKFKGGIQN